MFVRFVKPIPALLLISLLVTLSGCQNRPASNLEGRWDLILADNFEDGATDKNGDSSHKAADDTGDLFDSIAGGESVGTMSLVFHRNGKLETFTDFPMASTGKPKVGLWSLSSWDENSKVATLSCELMDEVTETTVTFVDDDTIQLIPPNIAVLKMELRFRRRK